ncbi:(2Fe-2S) ferredoxin domain-containing protein [Carboxylicivirga linearis]|uniref:(2Fe-2S) ferredoxin domain-containing protein n=1 Tax=Carboxylicivirga linearis TaxID=1628157 RepID=A0ABS5JZ86_9BACT|nr:(2Fe-2S) ferredoxin domain-containing protein [Carboxylicivirga linearis]MBS2100168.1 (2Fe-2S) ferredoxin domain-containing protein [Carboxylicivirga linearis]
MTKVKSLADLRKMKEEMANKVQLREKGDHPDQLVQVKVSMATCGIASGAKEVMNHLIDQLDQQAIEAVVTQTGCMGYCYAEPTIEVTLPNSSPVVFGYVDTKKASEIISRYIIRGELVDGIIPVNYETVNEKKKD